VKRIAHVFVLRKQSSRRGGEKERKKEKKKKEKRKSAKKEKREKKVRLPRLIIEAGRGRKGSFGPLNYSQSTEGEKKKGPRERKGRGVMWPFQ